MQQQRLEKLRKILKEKNLDGFLISNFYNILYLTGFKTLTENEREGWGLITTNSVYLFTDLRYVKSPSFAKASPSGQPTGDKPEGKQNLKLITPEKGLIKHLQEIVEEEEIQHLGFEGDDLKVSELQKIKEHLTNIKLISLEKSVIKVREIKDEEEINNLRTACKITDQCLEEIVRTIKPGTSEKEIAFRIEFWLKEKDYNLSFYPIIAVDKNSAIPHYGTLNGTNEKVKNNSVILIDFGSRFKDYHSDMTRMIFVGKPTGEMVDVYKTLLIAQESTIKQLRIDDNPVSIDQFCRQQLTIHQSPTTSRHAYPHSTGHGVGLQIHEYPKISFTSTDVLLPNQVVTIEPGVYLDNKWGMRLEDIVLIKEGGQVEVLTKFEKKLLII